MNKNPHMPSSQYFPKLLAYVFLLLLCCNTQAAWFEAQRGIMGTEISLTFWHDKAEIAQEIEAAVFAEMHRIDDSLSPYIDSSELYLVNQGAADAEQVLSDELAMLIDKSLFMSRVTDGAFDITFASLSHLYDYRKGKQPSEAEKKTVLPAIDYHWLKFDASAKTLKFSHPYVRIDLGGIAKGHAVDRAIAILKQYGVKHASISAGGDTGILGDRRGRPWIIGIKNPRPTHKQAEAVLKLPLENVSLSTSGDYERYFIDEKTGERIHHILNPRTGKSANEVMSVSVMGDMGIDTDALSTSVFVMGVEKGLALINKLPGFDGIIIDIHGKVHYSDGLIAAD